MPKMKDQAREMEQRRMMGRVAAALGRALLRGLTRELPEHKAAVTAAWNAVAEALPALLAEELEIQEKEKAGMPVSVQPCLDSITKASDVGPALLGRLAELVPPAVIAAKRKANCPLY